MTMVACIINDSAPILVGDLLISNLNKPTTFSIPSTGEDVVKFLPDVSQYYPEGFYQKLYIPKPNVCIAFSGKVFYIKQFIEDISIFCKANEVITAGKMQAFLEGFRETDISEHFSLVMLVAEIKDNELEIGRVNFGKWIKDKTSFLGEIYASGSGAEDFLKEVLKELRVESNFKSSSIDYVLQTNTLMICNLLTQERLTLNTIKNFWGAGFEMIYWDKNRFTKMENITYIINLGKAVDGKIIDVPVPEVILNYRYYEDLLVITSIKLLDGKIRENGSFYIFSSKPFQVKQYVVPPIGYKGNVDSERIKKEVPFKSYTNGMGYLIETSPISYYTPVCFNSGQEIEVDFTNPELFTMKVAKSLNDKMMKESADGLNP